jgi:WD40 repeat protein
MNPIATCPDRDELLQLLDGSLSGERQQQCTEHIDTCSGCQAKLEEIATGGSNLSQVVERLHEADPIASAAYWPAVKALHSDVQPTVVPESGKRSRDLSLEFLEPPSDAAYLGRIAQFDVMRVLGRGGMGVVLEAFDSRLQRNVALKVLDPELAGDDVARQRFCREARTAASVTHENVVAVHQVEKSADDGLPFLVMQLISGESLEQRLARVGKLPVREVVRIALQAAQGLAAAHAQGLIHRDIKPGNILLETVQDRVKLTDFGLARVAEDVKLTRSGFVSGTPLYMAPEQALGEQPDPRSDVFSLGAVMYEMSAGHPPFAGNSALAILKQIADVKHRPLREVNPAAPDWLAETIDHLLEKKPENRIQSAALLAELLEFQWALLKTTSEDVPTVCQIEERKQTIRNRWIAAIVAATFLALGLAAGSFFANRGGSPASATAPVSSAEPVAVLSANAGTVWSVSFDPSGRTLAMGVEDGSVRLWDLEKKSVTATFPAHRGTVWVAQFSPGGELFASAGDDSLIKLWKPMQPESFQTYEHSNAVRSVAFGHDGKTLFAGVRDGHLRVWPLDGTEPLAEAQHQGSVYAVAVSPDDETLATAGNDKVVRLWNARTLTPKLPLEGHTGPVYALSFHPDGKRLASVGWDKTVRIWDAVSGQLIKSWVGHEGDIWGGAYSPDGSKFATGGHDGVVKLWNAETGELLATYLGHKLAVHVVAFSRDGTLLASGGRDGTARIWKVQ